MAESIDEIIALLQEIRKEMRDHFEEMNMHFDEISKSFDRTNDQINFFQFPQYPCPSYLKMGSKMRKKYNNWLTDGTILFQLNTPHY